jgi:ectoine hydroxylase-related dioxygenase (phytanoyl-CoA dioxygenase family)
MSATKKATAAAPSKPAVGLQKGTGMHVDVIAYDPYRKAVYSKDAKKFSLERVDHLRIAQSFVALTPGPARKDAQEGQLRVIPGAHHFVKRYFELDSRRPAADYAALSKFRPPAEGLHTTHFTDKYDSAFAKRGECTAQRIPRDWKVPVGGEQDPKRPTTQQLVDSFERKVERGDIASHDDVALFALATLAAEHNKLVYEPIQTGDMVIWQIMLPHKNADRNDGSSSRSVFYMSYMPAVRELNRQRLVAQSKAFQKLESPPGYISSKKLANKKALIALYAKEAAAKGIKPTMHAKMLDFLKDQVATYTEDASDEENRVEDVVCGMKAANKEVGEMSMQRFYKEFPAVQEGKHLVTNRHLAFLDRFGYVVVENVFDGQQCADLLGEIERCCAAAGCDVKCPEKVSAKDLEKVGSAFGGMIELFWTPQMCKARANPKAYGVVNRIYERMWLDIHTEQSYRMVSSRMYSADAGNEWFDDMDAKLMWGFVDRCNYRMPDALTAKAVEKAKEDRAEQKAQKAAAGGSAEKKRSAPSKPASAAAAGGKKQKKAPVIRDGEEDAMADVEEDNDEEEEEDEEDVEVLKDLVGYDEEDALAEQEDDEEDDEENEAASDMYSDDDDDDARHLWDPMEGVTKFENVDSDDSDDDDE